MSEHMDAFLEGWRKGDAQMILGAVADDFVYDDPVDGRFTRTEFAAYLEELFGGEDARSRAARGEAFETITDLVTQEKDGVETTWGWWTMPSDEGAGLVIAGPDGVLSERIAYYTRSAPA